MRVLGLDDFGFRRGSAPGTILVDPERHKVVDLFEGHSVGSKARWLGRHRIIARMVLTTPTAMVLVAAAIVVRCVAFPMMRRALVGLWDALESGDIAIFVFLALAIVGAVAGVVRWTLVRTQGDFLFRSF